MVPICAVEMGMRVVVVMVFVRAVRMLTVRVLVLAVLSSLALANLLCL
jgi:hypothetical protein